MLIADLQISGVGGRKTRVLPPPTVDSGMLRYFFDIYDGSSFSRDTVGTVCDGYDGIRFHAMRALPTIARDEIPKGSDQQAFTVIVRDENNITHYTANLSFVGLWIGGSTIPEPDEKHFSL